MSSAPTDEDISYSMDCDNRGWRHFRITWRIRNFSLRPEEPGCCIYSPIIPMWMSSNSKAEWRLKLYPSGLNTESKDYLSVFLKLYSCSHRKIICSNLEMSILNNEEKGVVQEKTNLHTGWSEFVRLDYLHDVKNNLLPGDTLTLECEVYYKACDTAVETSEDAPEFIHPEKEIAANIGSLFDKDTFSDVTLSTLGKNILAHKCILSARSSVFAAMFKHDMKENIENEVVISDIEFPVLHEMIRYMYTARKTKSLDQMADKLLIAANKYNVKELQIICEESLIANLSVDNVVARLLLAEMHSVAKLKTATIKFIATNIDEVARTNTWEDLFTSHPKLAADITAKFAEYLKLKN